MMRGHNFPRHHIQSKEDLLYFIFKYSMERIRDDVTPAVAKVEDPLGRRTP
jgi:hypothetical protein